MPHRLWYLLDSGNFSVSVNTSDLASHELRTKFPLSVHLHEVLVPGIRDFGDGGRRLQYADW